jgi:hypothetical protein
MSLTYRILFVVNTSLPPLYSLEDIILIKCFSYSSNLYLFTGWLMFILVDITILCEKKEIVFRIPGMIPETFNESHKKIADHKARFRPKYGN